MVRVGVRVVVRIIFTHPHAQHSRTEPTHSLTHSLTTHMYSTRALTILMHSTHALDTLTHSTHKLMHD